jgi:hypothetical protein
MRADPRQYRNSSCPSCPVRLKKATLLQVAQGARESAMLHGRWEKGRPGEDGLDPSEGRG